MNTYRVRSHRSDEAFPREEQLAWRIAEVAADPVRSTPRSPRWSSTASSTTPPWPPRRCAAPRSSPRAGRRRRTRSAARSADGVRHRGRFGPEWAAWANGVAVRELDFHDTFLAAEYSHPGDNIPPILAVAQHAGAGRRRARARHRDRLRDADRPREGDQPARAQDRPRRPPRAERRRRHRRAARAANETIFQAIGQALHTTTATRQSRKGEISSWKAYAPAFAGKAAIEAVDRAMRGQTSPAPIYEGEDGVIARLLDGPDGGLRGAAAGGGRGEAGDPRQLHEGALRGVPGAGVDRSRPPPARRAPGAARPGDRRAVVLHTSHHTHFVIGSGANDPQKYDPPASRETLDHSMPYIFAVALQDGVWHHADSYAAERAARPDTVALWRSISTAEDPEWTRRYHSLDPAEQAFGGRAEFELADGTTMSTRSRSPTRIRSAPGPSPGPTTSASSAPSPRACCAEGDRALPRCGRAAAEPHRRRARRAHHHGDGPAAAPKGLF